MMNKKFLVNYLHGFDALGNEAIRASVPAESNADVSRHPARKVDDLVPELVTFRTQMVVPEVINLLWESRQRLFPARLRLIDGAS